MTRASRREGDRLLGAGGRRVLLVLGLIAACSSGSAWAHSRSVSYSSWQLDSVGARVSVRVPLLELTRLSIPLPGVGAGDSGVGEAAVARYLSSHLELRSPEGVCALSGPPVAGQAEAGWLVYRWSLHCPSEIGREIESHILFDVAPSHLHFARVGLPPAQEGGTPRVLERVLTRAEPAWSLADRNTGTPGTNAGRGDGSDLLDYLRLGVEHILSGWDHLAFVLALILLAARLGEVARLVTGFTLAHSLTLALAVLGWLRPEPAPVEAIIGYSVALIAAENAWLMGGRPRWLPITSVLGVGLMALLAGWGVGSLSGLSLWGLALFSFCHFGLLRRSERHTGHRTVLAFAFGLVHGFGFAGVLAEMALPTSRMAPALLGFNLGVELGQLVVVAAIWPLLALLQRVGRSGLHEKVAQIGSAAICGVGLFWFVTRALGPG